MCDASMFRHFHRLVHLDSLAYRREVQNSKRPHVQASGLAL